MLKIKITFTDFPLAACLPNEHAYCCLMTAVAYVSRVPFPSIQATNEKEEKKNEKEKTMNPPFDVCVI